MGEPRTALPVYRTALLLGVTLGCFAIIYPRVIRPLLLNTLGMSKRPDDDWDNKRPPRSDVGRQPCRDPVTCREKPNAVPPMPTVQPRAKGMWASLLPFYSVGVIAFLLYTLAKMTLRDKSNAGGSENGRKHKKNSMGNFSDAELKLLREQLIETENAMTRLLQAVENGEINADGMQNHLEDAIGDLKELTQKAAKTLVEPRKGGDQLNDVVNELSATLNIICKSEHIKCSQSPAERHWNELHSVEGSKKDA